MYSGTFNEISTFFGVVGGSTVWEIEKKVLFLMRFTYYMVKKLFYQLIYQLNWQSPMERSDFHHVMNLN